jgi:GNAT superfamily N-acetyltransferase
MENIKIGSLNPEQWKEYKELRLKALKEEPQAYASTYEDNSTHTDEFWQDRLKDALKSESQWLLFAKKKNILVGMAGAFLSNEETAQIIAVFVCKEERGQGISKKLMKDLLIAVQKNKSIKRILVGVNPEQIVALNLYEKIGFKIIKKERLILGDNKEHDSYEMEMIIG